MLARMEGLLDFSPPSLMPDNHYPHASHCEPRLTELSELCHVQSFHMAELWEAETLSATDSNVILCGGQLGPFWGLYFEVPLILYVYIEGTFKFSVKT